MSPRVLFWSLCAFLIFGALAFLALSWWAWRAAARQRREEKLFAMDPVRRLRR